MSNSFLRNTQAEMELEKGQVVSGPGIKQGRYLCCLPGAGEEGTGRSEATQGLRRRPVNDCGSTRGRGGHSSWEETEAVGGSLPGGAACSAALATGLWGGTVVGSPWAGVQELGVAEGGHGGDHPGEGALQPRSYQKTLAKDHPCPRVALGLNHTHGNDS